MYALKNYKTKKAMKEAVAELNESNEIDKFKVFQPGPYNVGSHTIKPGTTVTLEGPHYPQPHKWYATVELSPDGKTLRVR